MTLITGRILEIGEIEIITDTFKKRQLAIEVTEGRYPQQIPLEFTQNNVHKLDAYKENDLVRVEFDLRGRSYDKKTGGTGYFLSLSAWRIEIELETMEEYNSKVGSITENIKDSGDELPF